MKKVIFGLVALFASSVALATPPGGYDSAASVSGAGAATGAAAGGYTYGNQGYSGSAQFSAAGATNETSAGSYNDSGRRGGSRDVGSAAHTEGTTYSYSEGNTIGSHAAGVTGGIAVQAGIARASAGGGVHSRTGVGGVATKSIAAGGSFSATANFNDGESYNESWSYADSRNDASLRIHNGGATHDVSSQAEAGGGSGGYANDAVQIGAGGGIAGGYAVSGAFTRNGNGGDGESEHEGGPFGNNGLGNGSDGPPPGHFWHGGGAHPGQDDNVPD